MKTMKNPALLAALLLLPGGTQAASLGAVGLSFLGDSSGGSTAQWLEPGAFYEATGFIQVTNFTDPTTPGAGNYVKFSGVTPAGDGTIVIVKPI